MQASQSTNAEGKRSFTSPFTAPILAARRLMERQQHTDNSGDLSESVGISAAESPDGLTGAWRGLLRYDEASIVAGLDAGLEAAESAAFEEGPDPSQNFALEEIDLSESNQTAFKSPFVSLGLGVQGNREPDLRWDRGPDPIAVRAAITRLARESQSKEAGAPKDVVKVQNATAFADAVAFEDVARRVWASAPHEYSAPAATVNLTVAEVASNFRIETEEPSASGEVSVSTASASPESAIVFDESAPAAGVDISDLIVSNETILAEVQDAPKPFAVTASAPASITPTSEEGECLAHDAGNLLSAMRLYSELLCISGVLQERHRHYADDLKLLATRSQNLIDRLLKLGAQLSGTRPEDLAPGQVELEPQTGASSEVQIQEGFDADLKQYTLDGGLASDAPAVEAALAAATDLHMYEPEARPEEGSATDRGDRLSEQSAPESGIHNSLIAIPELNQGGTSIAATLERLGNLLQTISHGALRIDLGPDAALPVGIGLEPLERILVNLVCNATAALSADGAIRVRAGARDGGEQGQPRTLVLTVDDSGRGMTPEQIRAALGERDEGTTQPSGATPRRGLGLSIVRQLVAASGGRLLIQSRPGRGTRIEIHWEALAQVEELPHQVAQSFAAPSPEPLSSDPGAVRKPVGVSRSAVARIRAGSFTGDGGAVAC